MIRIRHEHLTVLAVLAALTGSTAYTAHGAGAGNSWTTVAPLPSGRWNASAASAAGKVFVFGGFGCTTNDCPTFDAYDPATNTWAANKGMPTPLSGPISTTTGADGHIYLYGWAASARGSASPSGATILVYDPRANTWSHEAPPPGVQDSAQLVTGLDNRIYAVGGRVNGSPVGTLSSLNASTHTWTTLAPFPVPRESFGVAVGPDGRVYVIGGYGVGNPNGPNRVDAYDPTTNAWFPVAKLPTPRGELRAVTGPDGRIYAIGGGTGSRCFTSPCNMVEAYDIRTKTWTAVADLPHPRWLFAAVLGPDQRIYVLGGSNTVAYAPPEALVTAVDAYTVVPANQPLPRPAPGPIPAAKTLKPMPTGRGYLGAVTGPEGKIYAIGGVGMHGPQIVPPGRMPEVPKILRTVEAYDPKTDTWSATPALPAARQGMGVATGPDGRIYVLGGVSTAWDVGGATLGGLRSVLIYDPRARRWSTGKPMPDGRYGLAAVTGKDGRIYTIGGATHCYPGDARRNDLLPRVRALRRSPMPQAQSEPCVGTHTVRSFDPRTGAWKSLASLRIGRILPATTLGPDGRIFVFGWNAMTGTPDPRFEVYDPRVNRWSWGPRAPHFHADGFAAAAARDGRIYLIGGCFIREIHMGGFSAFCGSPSPVDAYDPRSNRWTTVGMTLNMRTNLAATTGPDGRVYAVGGSGDGNGQLLEVIR